MKLLAAVPVALLAVSGSPLPTPVPAAMASLRLEITSSDSLRPVTAELLVRGRIAGVGGRPPGGSVQLEGEKGTLTTPAVIDVLDGPVVIELRTLNAAPGVVLEVRPTTGQVDHPHAALPGRERHVVQ